ncbi:Serine protease Do-like HtrA [Enhygromyxa salina]|uniref:Serine protease Do-like HtrA n=1 Tax=Enhygromyxa salina TaxID=215803 RepID=A0A2S9XX88_9BACT|nr:trypsin-like peptidase domain-containing protein [Enhygromyxa salina]PRP97463.1 Serine protease Do-like HtrA [Enhygromyxa salina]
MKRPRFSARQVGYFVGLLGVLVPELGSAQQPPADPSQAAAPVSGATQSDAAAEPPAGPTPGASNLPAPTWSGSLSIQRCTNPAPQLPLQTEFALSATLIVRVPGAIGSAVLISPDGFALTAGHVVGDNQTVSLLAYGGAEITGQVVRVDAVQDIALIKAHVADGAPCLSPFRQRVPLGSDVFVLGSPAGEELSFSVAKGIVSGYRNLGGQQFVQLDAAVNPGNSGGPVVSTSGEVIGIASWKVADVTMEGLSFAVPSDVAMSSLELEFADASAADWISAGGRRVASPRPAPGASADVDLTASPNPAPSSVDRAMVRRRAVRTSFIVSGSVLLSVGAIGAAATGVAYYLDFDRRMSTRGWTGLLVGNTASWVLVGTGAAALLTGIVLPKRPKKARETGLSVVPTLGGAVMTGSF